MSEPKGAIISLLKSSAARFVSQWIATLNKKTKKSEIFGSVVHGFERSVVTEFCRFQQLPVYVNFLLKQSSPVRKLSWASLKKGANLKITVSIRLTRKMWTLIGRRWYLGIYSQTLYVLFRDRQAHARLKIKTAEDIDFKRRGNCFISSYIYVKPYICLVLYSCCSRILLIRHCFYMCILYCCEGHKLDNSLGYYVTFVK